MPYTVVAVDNAGNRALASPPVTIVFDHTPPPAPSIAQAATPTGSLPNLTWTSGGADLLSGFDHYVVFRDGVAVGAPTTPAFLDASLATLGPHLYVVRAVDVAGNMSASSPARTVVYDTQPPPTAGDLTVPTPTNAPVLTWTASNDDSTGGSGVVGYHVYRDGQLIATPSAPTYADVSLTISGSHAYWVTAIDAVGNESPPSPTRIVAIDLDPPQAPPDLTAPSPTQRPTLSWGAATDVGPGPIAIDHYNVYRDGTLVARSSTTELRRHPRDHERTVHVHGARGRPGRQRRTVLDGGERDGGHDAGRPCRGSRSRANAPPAARCRSRSRRSIPRGRPSASRSGTSETARRTEARSRTSTTRPACTRSRSRRATPSATRRPRRTATITIVPRPSEGREGLDQGSSSPAPEGASRTRLAAADNGHARLRRERDRPPAASPGRRSHGRRATFRTARPRSR